MCQTYLVTGGSKNPGLLSSTELLVETAAAWVFSGELPSPRSGLRGANIDGMILMTGNKWRLLIRELFFFTWNSLLNVQEEMMETAMNLLTALTRLWSSALPAENGVYWKSWCRPDPTTQSPSSPQMNIDNIVKVNYRVIISNFWSKFIVNC